MKNTIFVAIASYIDYEIRHTILDCINKSKYPDNLTFSICLQFDDREKTNKHCIDDLVEKYNIKVHSTYQDMLSDDEVDVVYIGLPTLLHGQLTEK